MSQKSYGLIDANRKEIPPRDLKMCQNPHTFTIFWPKSLIWCGFSDPTPIFTYLQSFNLESENPLNQSICRVWTNSVTVTERTIHLVTKWKNEGTFSDSEDVKYAFVAKVGYGVFEPHCQYAR